MSTITHELSNAVQDYLKAIYALECAGEPATTSAVAARMTVAAPSATAMLKRLDELELVQRLPYHGVVLTEAGRRCALEVVRHHRLLERYLADTLGMTLAEVHAEAEKLEHALSEQLEARIDEALGFPTHDPHGDPIPDRELRISAGSARVLGDLAPGDRSTDSRVPGGDAELLRYLSDLALVPGAEVELTAIAPAGGPLSVRTGSGDHAITRELAASIDVD